MKKNIVLILLLMSLCVTGIVGLQLFWNYQNYQNTVKAFDHDINEALVKALEKERDQRQEQIVKRFKGWLADTSLITITANRNNRDSATVFYIQDTHPKFKGDKNRKTQFGLADFKEKLDHITPKAKAKLIEHFGERILKPDLKEGTVYYYTQMLGDSLEKVFSSNTTNPDRIALLFRQQLEAKNIYADFVLNPVRNDNLYLTRPVNTSFRKPYQKEFVDAGFEHQNRYFFKEIKWVIITSLLLIVITIGCFAYTVKTLLSQHKLAELKDAFINNMTHELNTPIASIKITAEALQAFKYSPDKQHEYLSIIAHQADKLSELTNQILTTEQVMNNALVNKERVGVNELISKAIDDLRVQIEYRESCVDYIPATTAAYLNGDPDSLGKAIVNLLDNALKYSLGRPAVAIAVSTSLDHVDISISDHGIGIPQEYNRSIFEQFFRVPQGNLHDVKGFGLGLSYVKEVIEQHNGKIFVSKNYPTGSRFTIKLPLY